MEYRKIVKELRENSFWAIKSFRDLMNKAADAIEELSRENESLAKSVNEASEILQKRWIPVTERLPLRGDAVLCVGDNGISLADFVCGDKWCALPWFYVDGEQETNVTHWMSLPTPPKEETE